VGNDDQKAHQGGFSFQPPLRGTADASFAEEKEEKGRQRAAELQTQPRDKVGEAQDTEAPVGAAKEAADCFYAELD